MVMETGAQNTYYYRPSALSSRYKTVPAVTEKKSINSINSIDDDDYESFKPDYNTFIKPYNPFGNNGWARPAAVQQKPTTTQYKWKFDSIESDESDEYYRRPSTRQAKPVANKPPVSYYHSDSSESDEVYYRRPASKPIAKKAPSTYYHSDESDEDIYRRFLASYRSKF
jgi:hypothetical protein